MRNILPAHIKAFMDLRGLPEINQLPRAKAKRKIRQLVLSRVHSIEVDTKFLRAFLEASLNMKGDLAQQYLIRRAVKPPE